jgi:hypothetical protein
MYLCLVCVSLEGNGGAQHGVEDVRVVVQQLVDHQAEDAHLGGTAVVELDGHLLVDGGLVPLALLQVDLLDLRLAGLVAHLQEGDGHDELGKHVGGDGGEAVQADLAVLQAREAEAGGCDNVAQHRHHGDTAVLHLDLSVEGEGVLIGTLHQAKGIPEACKNGKAQRKVLVMIQHRFDGKRVQTNSPKGIWAPICLLTSNAIFMEEEARATRAAGAKAADRARVAKMTMKRNLLLEGWKRVRQWCHCRFSSSIAASIQERCIRLT